MNKIRIFYVGKHMIDVRKMAHKEMISFYDLCSALAVEAVEPTPYIQWHRGARKAYDNALPNSNEKIATVKALALYYATDDMEVARIALPENSGIEPFALKLVESKAP